jgi:hypothetical protein
MPKSEWETYRHSSQLELLQDVKASILNRYPKTNVRVDRLVVTVTYNDFHVEVQPVFEQDDGSFKYPDTNNGGSWKITKPREEMAAFVDLNIKKNANLRRLCRMARSWRNMHGVVMGGLLVDTLAYNFLQATTEYDTTSFCRYDELSRDFFRYLAELPRQDRYNAPGSKQHVKVKKAFQHKANKAHELCVEAIAAENTTEVNNKWRKVYGRPFPSSAALSNEDAIAADRSSCDNTEQFIEDRYPVDIHYSLKIDCDVKQNGFREHRLSRMILNRLPLLAEKTLEFEIVQIDIPGKYSIEWKVLNRGDEARRRNEIRGEIIPDAGRHSKTEPTAFRGDHIVECYAVQDSVVVAKDRIHVPIANG